MNETAFVLALLVTLGYYFYISSKERECRRKEAVAEKSEGDSSNATQKRTDK